MSWVDQTCLVYVFIEPVPATTTTHDHRRHQNHTHARTPQIGVPVPDEDQLLLHVDGRLFRVLEAVLPPLHVPPEKGDALPSRFCLAFLSSA